jgi:hypothetical protein
MVLFENCDICWQATGLLHPISASIATTTYSGWALLIVAAVQGYPAWTPQRLRETSGAVFVSDCALFMGSILLWGPISDGGFIYNILALLPAISGEAILGVHRSLRSAPRSITLNRETRFLIDLRTMAGSVSIDLNGPLETGGYPPELTLENKPFGERLKKMAKSQFIRKSPGAAWFQQITIVIKKSSARTRFLHLAAELSKGIYPFTSTTTRPCT